MTERRTPLEVVREWQKAVGDGDPEKLLGLSDPEVEISGPRGSGYGRELLGEWLERAGLSLEELRAFRRGNAVVVWNRGVWKSPETGEVSGEAEVACSYRVEHGLVSYFARYDDLDRALEEAGIEPSDEVAS